MPFWYYQWVFPEFQIPQGISDLIQFYFQTITLLSLWRIIFHSFLKLTIVQMYPYSQSGMRSKPIWEAKLFHLRQIWKENPVKNNRTFCLKYTTLYRNMHNIKPLSWIIKNIDLKTRYDLLTTHHTQNIILKNNSSFYEHGEKSGKLLAQFAAVLLESHQGGSLLPLLTLRHS